MSPTRRQLLVGGGAATALAVAAGAAGWQVPAIRRRLDPEPAPYVPDAPEGQVLLERRDSAARGREVDLFVARPAGHTDERLPVVLVLHGATGRPTDYRRFGFGQFVSAVVAAGAAPFALVGPDGGRLRWEPSPDGADDPRAMLTDELPGWLAELGLDDDRVALWGWSMGGYGALRLVQTVGAGFGAVAAFSPAIASGDAVAQDADALDLPVGLWCGTEDPFVDATRELAGMLPREPEIASFTPGRHTRTYWNAHTEQALSFLARHLVN